MALTIGSDSYLSITTADNYHNSRDNTAWTTQTTSKKEIALRIASFWIDDWFKGRWKGVAVNDELQLSWPRFSVLDEEGRSITGIPQAVQRATAEMALKSLNTELAPDLEVGGVLKNIQLGELGKTYFADSDPHKYYTMVERMLAGLLVENKVNCKLVRV